MTTLGVVNRAETFERMQEPLADRDIDVRHVPVTERAIHVSGSEETPVPPNDLRGMADEFDVGHVFPGRLMEGSAVDALLEVPWVNDREAVLTSRNKGGVLATLDRAGLSTPATTMVSNPADSETLAAVFDRFDPPVVVKPNSATRGVGVTRVGDLDSFLGVCDYLGLVHDYRATGDKSFLVQEYLPDARDLRVMTVAGEYVGAVERRLPETNEGWKHNVHRGATATGVDPPTAVRRTAERVARHLGIDFLGVDLLVSEDRVVVSETNARPTIDEARKYDPGFYDRYAELVERRAEQA